MAIPRPSAAPTLVDTRFFESYVSDLISRDVRQVTEIERPADMRRLLNLICASMATLSVPTAFANRLRVPASTVKRYLDLRGALNPAWSTNLTTRAVATPKLIVFDTGLAGHLAENEVDAILERASGEVVAVEVKAAETVRGEDFRAIRHLARRLGDQLLAGIVLYAGRQALPFGERLCALPISALWTSSLYGVARRLRVRPPNGDKR